MADEVETLPTLDELNSQVSEEKLPTLDELNGVSAKPGYDIPVFTEKQLEAKGLPVESALDKRLPFLQAQAKKRFENDPDMKDPNMRALYYNHLLKPYSGEEKYKVRQALIEVDPVMKMGSLGEPTHSIQDAGFNTIESGVKRVGSTGEVYNNEGLGAAIFHAGVGVGETALGVAGVVSPQVAAFNTATEAVQEVIPQTKETLSPASTAVNEAYGMVGLKPPAFMEDAGLATDFLWNLALFGGASVAKGKIFPKEVIEKATPETIRQAQAKTQADNAPHPNEEKITALQSDIEKNPGSPASEILKGEVDKMQEQIASDQEAKAKINANLQTLVEKKSVLQSDAENLSEAGKAAIVPHIENIDRELTSLLPKMPEAVEAPIQEQIINAEAKGEEVPTEKIVEQINKDQTEAIVEEPPAATFTAPEIKAAVEKAQEQNTAPTLEQSNQFAIDFVNHDLILSNESVTGEKAGRRKSATQEERLDLGMDYKEKNKAIKDIKSGNYESVPAKKLIDKLSDMHQRDEFPMMRGTGGHTDRFGAFTRAESETLLNNAKEDRAAAFHAEQLHQNLSEEDKSTIDNIIEKYSDNGDVQWNELIKDIDEGFPRTTDLIDAPKQIIEKILSLHDESQRGEPQATDKGNPSEPEAQIPPAEPPAGETTEGDGEQKLAGISHEAMAQSSELLGIESPERGEFANPQEQIQKGRDLISGGTSPEQVLQDFNKDGKISSDAIGVVRAHQEQLLKNVYKAVDEFGENSSQDKAARAELEKWQKDTKPMATEWHKIGQTMQGQTDIDTGTFVGMREAFKEEHGKDMTPKQTAEAKALSGKVKSLTDEVDALKKKLTQTIDAAVSEGAKEVKKTYTQRAKKIADEFRKLKTKPFTFTDSNGNVHELHTMGLTWNDAVELGAKAIEKTGVVADGVKAVIEKLKDVDWYKSLDESDKKKFSEQLEHHYSENTPEGRKIKSLQSKLDELLRGDIRVEKEKIEDSQEVKQLKDEIRNAKENLGLIKGRTVPDTKLENETIDKISEEQKKLDRLQKQLDDLREGKTKEAKAKSEDSEKAKALKDEIRSEKEKLGLVPAKAIKETAAPEIPEVSDVRFKFVDKKDSSFTPDDVKEIWNYAKENYLDKESSFDDMIHGVAMDLGLSPNQVRSALSQPKGARVITDEMYAKQNRRSTAVRNAKEWIKTANTPKLIKFAKAVPNVFFGVATFGHGTVGMITHVGMNIYKPSSWGTYFPNFFRQFDYAYGGLTEAGLARYERAMVDLQKDPDYIFWKRNGLAVDPNKRFDDYQTFQKYFGKLGMAGDRGFNALKVFRLETAKNIYEHLSQVEKADPETAKKIAEIVNHSSGTSKVPVPEGIGVAFFAPRLEASRWLRLIAQPTEAIKTFTNWKNATPAEKASAKIVAKRAGEMIATYYGLLAVNQGLLSASGSTQKINFADPTQKDWMKFKAGNKTFDLTGGMVSTLGFLSRLVEASAGNQKELRGEKRFDKMGGEVGDYLRGKLSPFGATAVDVVSQADFQGNPMPFSSDKPSGSRHKLSWKEYISQHVTPIPVSEAFRDVAQSMKEKGMTEVQIDDVLNGVLIGTISGGTGARVGISPKSEQEKKEFELKNELQKRIDKRTSKKTEQQIIESRAERTKKFLREEELKKFAGEKGIPYIRSR